MKYRPEVDGLRALAVVPVILFHADFYLFAGGFVGVDIFFVISGYLITTIIIKELDAGNFSIVNFYERRARRILPALFFVMLVCLPLSWVFLISPDMQNFGQSLVAVSVFGANILFWLTGGYFETASELKPLLHTWSLSLEEQFYVIFPVLMLTLWRFRKRLVVTILVTIGLVSLAFAQLSVVAYPDASFYLLHTRAWELLVGSFVAFYFYWFSRRSDHRQVFESRWLHELCGVSGLVLIVYAIFTFDAETPFPSLYTLIPVVGTALILTFANPNTLVGKLFCHKALVGIGLISYSLYLWHQPLFAYARHYAIGDPSIPVYLLLSVLSIGLAYLSWKYIEAPFRSRKKFTRRQIFSLSILGSAFFIAIGLVGHFTNGQYFRSYDTVQRDLLSTMEQRGANSDCWRQLARGNYESTACLIGSAEAKQFKEADFALIGDSHAGALTSRLHLLAEERGTWGYNYSYTSCVPIFDVVPIAASRRYTNCLSIRDHYQQLLQDGALPETLIVTARWGIYFDPEPFNNQEGGREPHGHVKWVSADEVYADSKIRVLESLRETLELMVAKGHRVILVDPVPEMGWDVPYRLKQLYGRNGQLGADDSSIALSTYYQRNADVLNLMEELELNPGVVRLRVVDSFCDEQRCKAHFESRPLYYDRDHISEFGAELILEQIRDELFKRL